MKRRLKVFCNETTLHGFKYVTQYGRKTSEKVFWSLSLIVSMALTSILLYNFFQSYNRNPIVIGTDQNQISVTDIFFPAVTICPSLIFNTAKVKTVDYKRLTEALQKNETSLADLSLNQLKYMQIISLVSRDNFFSDFNVSIPTDDFIKKLKSFPPFLEDNRKYFNDQFYSVSGNWSNRYLANLTHVLCPSGICGVFNFPNSSQFYRLDKIAAEFNYSRMFVLTIYRYEGGLINYPVKGPKSNLGLLLIISSKKFLGNGSVNVFQDIHSKETKDGFDIIFHDPFEVPSDASVHFQTKSNRTLNYYITPELTEIDDSLIGLSPEERNCYLPDEKRLQFLKAYSKKNCEHECKASATLKACSCVQFFMVREESTRICGVADEKCFKKIEENFIIIKDDCKCFDACRRLRYDIQVIDLGSMTPDYEWKSILNAKFAVGRFFPLKRRIQFSRVEIVAYMGGLLGLFAGFSMLSIAEFAHSVCLRPFLKLFRNKIHPPGPERSLDNKVSYLSQYLRASSIGSFNFIARETSKAANDYRPDLQDLNEASAEYFIGLLFGSRKTNWVEVLRERFMNDKTVVDLVVCYNFAQFFTEDFYFNFSSPSVVVNLLGNRTEPKRWWNERRATWNSISDPPFSETLTRHGIGFSFNMIDAEDLLNFTRVSDDFKDLSVREMLAKPKPWKAEENSKLEVSLAVNRFFIVRKFQNCQENSFIVHDPSEWPSIINKFEFTYGRSLEVGLSVDVIETEEDVRSISVEKRQCYFKDERKLKLFKIYTRSNCEMECISMVILANCGCVPFYYLRTKTTNVCNVQGTECAWRFQTVDFGELENLYGEICTCLPLCDSITYNLEFLTERYSGNYSERISNETTITFKFKESEFYPLRRYRRFTFQSFLSNAGGLMGLLAGASLLSIVEFVYFFTLRGFINVWRCFQRHRVPQF